MANAAAVREWMHAQGRPAIRGRIPKPVIAEWDAAHPDDPYEAAPPAGAYISDEEMDDLFPDVDPGPELAETKPRPVPRSRGRAAPAGGGIRGLFGGKPKPKGKKKPRVSTESLLSSVWRGMAKLTMPLPPVHRTLRIQAPVAGMILEDAVKDTVADVVLQPFARLAQAGTAASALLGPPLFVGAMTLHAQQRAAAGQEPNPLFMTLAQEGLRASLINLMSVAEDKFIEAARREQEIEQRFGGDMDFIIAFLFSEPPATPAQFEAEEAVFRRIVNPEPATM